MALALPQFMFCDEVDSLPATPQVSIPGVNFTAKASNVDGTAVSILSALAFDVHYLVIALGGINTSGALSSTLVDLLVDPAGGTSWVSFIDDLVCGESVIPAAGTTGIDIYYHFPIFIKAGNSVGIRARTSQASDVTSGRCVIWAYGNPTRPDMWWCGEKVETLGVTAASSSATLVTPGSTGADGSWTSVGSATTARYGAIQLGFNGGPDTTTNIFGYYLKMGVGSAKLPGTPTLYVCSTTLEVFPRTGFCQPIWCDVPSGTQMQAMVTCTTAGEDCQIALYGVY